MLYTLTPHYDYEEKCTLIGSASATYWKSLQRFKFQQPLYYRKTTPTTLRSLTYCRGVGSDARHVKTSHTRDLLNCKVDNVGNREMKRSEFSLWYNKKKVTSFWTIKS
ncbi:unnamed protein product [Ceratitis capitata]|uniref:(Mediterranean fruit fly) hypothetical protein n=1 Tax=Ceratitis capitata TaxID=7213 RepID=A0A811UFT0_CERCA|nr:unnamed protein product [Ceratitis capitata]